LNLSRCHLYRGPGRRGALLSSSTRLLFFAAPAVWMSHRPHFQMRHLWQLSVLTVTLQMIFNLGLLRREFGRKLNFTAGS